MYKSYEKNGIFMDFMFSNQKEQFLEEEMRLLRREVCCTVFMFLVVVASVESSFKN
jgi:hypothetical protein